MNKLVLAALGALALLGVSGGPPAVFAFSDAKIGGAVSALIRTHGSPDVVTTNVGHVWTWDTAAGSRLRVTTDDDGIVQIIDVRGKGPTEFAIPAEDPQQRLNLVLNALTLQASDASRLAQFAEGAGTAAYPDTGAPAQFRAYKFTPQTDLVLLFNDTDNALGEAFFGLRPALARGGLLPASAGQPVPHFTAPTVVHLGAFDYPNGKAQGDAFVRIAVGKDGKVKDATIYASSGNADLDRIALLAARQDTFVPAKLDDNPVDAIFFHKEEFRTLAAPLH